MVALAEESDIEYFEFYCNTSNNPGIDQVALSKGNFINHSANALGIAVVQGGDPVFQNPPQPWFFQFLLQTRGRRGSPVDLNLDQALKKIETEMNSGRRKQVTLVFNIKEGDTVCFSKSFGDFVNHISSLTEKNKMQISIHNLPKTLCECAYPVDVSSACTLSLKSPDVLETNVPATGQTSRRVIPVRTRR